MKQLPPEIEALAEALADARGEADKFKSELDKRAKGVGDRFSNPYNFHVTNALGMAAYLAKRGWRVVRDDSAAAPMVSDVSNDD